MNKLETLVKTGLLVARELYMGKNPAEYEIGEIFYKHQVGDSHLVIVIVSGKENGYKLIRFVLDPPEFFHTGMAELLPEPSGRNGNDLKGDLRYGPLIGGANDGVAREQIGDWNLKDSALALKAVLFAGSSPEKLIREALPGLIEWIECMADAYDDDRRENVLADAQIVKEFKAFADHEWGGEPAEESDEGIQSDIESEVDTGFSGLEV